MKEVGLSGFDRFLGALLGVVKGALAVAVVLMGMDRVHSDLVDAGQVGAGAILPGGRKSCHLVGAVGLTGKVR